MCLRILLALLLFIAACSEPTAEVAVPDGVDALVVHVSDGDSLIVEIEGVEEKVRLIGINAPEQDECFGAESKIRLEALVLGRLVTLVEDIETTDQYGRMLRFVYLDGSHVNEDLVAGGFAIARSYEPNTSREADLTEAEELARRGQVGMWAADGCAVASEVRIDHVQADAPGPDDQNLNGEWVEITNGGSELVPLTGWSLRDAESANRFLFPTGSELEPGDSLRISTGCGRDEVRSLYWCSSGPVWNNSGDVAFLLDPAGKTADRFEYRPSPNP